MYVYVLKSRFNTSDTCESVAQTLVEVGMLNEVEHSFDSEVGWHKGTDGES